MNKNYRIKTVVFSSGERHPILLGRDGLPIFEPTVFSLTEVRSRNRASNTIESYLRSILILLLFLELRKINLEERLKVGHLLSLGEIEDLVSICRLPVEKIHTLINETTSNTNQNSSSVYSIENFRKRQTVDNEKRIDGHSAANRLRNISDYLNWLCLTRISKHGIDPTLRSTIESSNQYVSNAIDARLPSGAKGYSPNNPREGLANEVLEKILSAIKPNSVDNPWLDTHCKYRNELIILCLLHGGFRRGELLNIRISDVDFRANSVKIVRRADDVNDPRTHQPKVKTLGREFPFSSGLMEKIDVYIQEHRSSIKGARKHDFLFVSSVDGKPLSLKSISKLVKLLGKKLPENSVNLFPHIFRHTWNEAYTREMENSNVSEIDKQYQRSYLMGWSQTSDTAKTYTKGQIRKKAQEASLKMQNKLIEKFKDE
jgi:integrase